MNIEKMKTILEGFKNTSVLVIGDYMVDEYIVGNADRISPEAPVQVIDVKKESRVPGGAGNVVRNISSFTRKIYAAGIIGVDEPGNYLKNTFNEYGADCSCMVASENRKTIIKTRVMAGRQQILRFDREDKEDINEVDSTRLLKKIEEISSNIDVVILSDYGKGCLTYKLIEKIMVIFSKKFVPVLVDPKGDDYLKYKGAHLVTPNLKETEIAVGSVIENSGELETAAVSLQKKCGINSVLVTLSEKGMTLFTETEKPYHIGTRAQEVFDVTGAGDTVISLMGLCLGSNIQPSDSVDIANIGAGIVVGKLGTASVTGNELLAEIKNMETDDTSGKIIAGQELDLEIGRLRKLNKKIVFTNGIFDFMHVGHLKLLQKSKKLGDILVVGINSDQSTREVKGEGRPIISEMERALIIASMIPVDYVVIFDELTPVPLIKRIKPDILVKGSNYEKVSVIGSEAVEEYGGEVKLVKIDDYISVTMLADRIKKIE